MMKLNYFKEHFVLGNVKVVQMYIPGIGIEMMKKKDKDELLKLIKV